MKAALILSAIWFSAVVLGVIVTWEASEPWLYKL